MLQSTASCTVGAGGVPGGHNPPTIGKVTRGPVMDKLKKPSGGRCIMMLMIVVVVPLLLLLLFGSASPVTTLLNVDENGRIFHPRPSCGIGSTSM